MCEDAQLPRTATGPKRSAILHRGIVIASPCSVVRRIREVYCSQTRQATQVETVHTAAHIDVSRDSARGGSHRCVLGYRQTKRRNTVPLTHRVAETLLFALAEGEGQAVPTPISRSWMDAPIHGRNEAFRISLSKYGATASDTALTAACHHRTTVSDGGDVTETPGTPGPNDGRPPPNPV